MNGISGAASSMHLAAGSLAVHSVGMQVAAHNIANISTDNFEPQRAIYATGPSGIGVELETVAPQRPSPIGDTADISVESRDLAKSLPESGTELAREIPQMISTERGFQANAATIRATDEMMGALLNSIA